MKKIIILIFTLSLLCLPTAYADEITNAKTTALSELDALFALYDEFDYREADWTELVDAYNNGRAKITTAETKADIFSELNKAAEEMISLNPRRRTITAYISVENLVLQKGFIVFPEQVKVPKYQSVAKSVSDLLEDKNQNIRQPLIINGTIEKDFEIFSIYIGETTNIADDTEISVPNFLINYTDKYLPIPTDKTYLNSGDYTIDSCFVYSVNNKFPNVKASAVPVIEDDVIRIQFSVYGKGADVGANTYTSLNPIFSSSDKTELFTILAKTVKENDMKLLLSNENNKDKFNDALVVAEIVNISQKAVDKAVKKLLSIEPVSTLEEKPQETPETEHDTTPDKNPTPIDFSDVADGHFAKEAIDYLSAGGVLKGKSDGSFGIDDSITRGEFVTILARYEKQEEYQNIPFKDVNSDDWFAAGVAFSYKNGITNGKSTDEFQPNVPISRQELATMIYRYMNYKGITKASELKPEFTDNELIEPYAQKAVDDLKNMGIISGRDDNTFTPFHKATRGETAKIFYNVIK